MIFDHDDMAAPTAYYREHGFVGLRGLVDEKLVASIAPAVDRASAVRATVESDYFARLDTENSFNLQYTQYANLHEQDAALAAVAFDEAIARAAATLESTSLAFLFSSSLHKLPFADPLRAHHDLRQMPFESPHMITAWIALDDVSARNGCLYYLPGTQRMGVARAKDSAASSFKQSSSAYLDFYSEYDAVEPVFAEVPRGTIMLHSGLTIHGSTANISRQSRRAFSISYVGADVTCTNPDHPLLRDLHVGQRFSDSPLHPVVYSRGA